MNENTNTSSVRKDQPTNLIELVAIPAHSKVIVEPFKGSVKDKYGYLHGFFPEEIATRLLEPNGALRWALVSGADSLSLRYQNGNKITEEIKVRHTIVPSGKDGMVWKPVSDR